MNTRNRQYLGTGISTQLVAPNQFVVHRWGSVEPSIDIDIQPSTSILAKIKIIKIQPSSNSQDLLSSLWYISGGSLEVLDGPLVVAILGKGDLVGGCNNVTIHSESNANEKSGVWARHLHFDALYWVESGITKKKWANRDCAPYFWVISLVVDFFSVLWFFAMKSHFIGSLCNWIVSQSCFKIQMNSYIQHVLNNWLWVMINSFPKQHELYQFHIQAATLILRWTTQIKELLAEAGLFQYHVLSRKLGWKNHNSVACFFIGMMSRHWHTVT